MRTDYLSKPRRPNLKMHALKKAPNATALEALSQNKKLQQKAPTIID